MNQSDAYYIVPKLPSYGFPCEDNRHGTCGQHVLKTIIEAWHGGPFRTRQEYSTGPISRITGNMMPRNLKKILTKHGLKSKYISCLLTRKKPKLEYLKSHIKKGPVILLISHAYSSQRDFSIRRAFTKQHRIGLWGYNDKERVFYVYDANVKKKNDEEKNLPAGNIVLSYDKIIRYRRLSMRGLHRNFGIAVEYPK